MSIFTSARPYRIPGYLRPRPATVLGLAPPAWAAVLGLAAMAAVELASRTGVVSKFDLVPPSRMAARAVGLLTDTGFLTGQLVPSIGLIAATFAIAGGLGVAAAYLLWRSEWCRKATLPLLGVYYAVPVFAVYPILVVLFGVGTAPILVVSVAFAVVVVITNSLTGFDSVPATVTKLARARRLTARQYLTKVLLPAAVPDIVAGLRLGLVYSTIGVLATEFILSTKGLGHFIADAYHTFRVDDMYAGILLICVVALILNATVAAMLGRIDWRRR